MSLTKNFNFLNLLFQYISTQVTGESLLTKKQKSATITY